MQMIYRISNEDGLRQAIEQYQQEHYAEHGTLPSDAIYNAARELLFKEWLYADQGSPGAAIMQELAESRRFGQHVIAGE